MCGIFLSLSCTEHLWPSEDLEKLLKTRGPDAAGKLERVSLPAPSALNTAVPTNKVHLSFLSTVLSLRGDATIEQPFNQDSDSPILCWNGEVWTIEGQPTEGNDTKAVYEVLTKATGYEQQDLDRAARATEAAGRIAEALSHITGPYAFVFYDSSRGMLYFGRDLLGRRSLLSRWSAEGNLFLSSVTDGRPADGWTEVEADGIYYVDLQAPDADTTGSPQGPPYTYSKVPYAGEIAANGNSHDSAVSLSSLNKQIPVNPQVLRTDSPSVVALESHLRRALSLRTHAIPIPPSLGQQDTAPPVKLAVLFSGGLDCTVLARMSHDLLPLSESIDLLNVAFENPRVHKNAKLDGDKAATPYELCPDRVTGRASFAELQRVCPDRHWRFVAVNIPYSETTAHRDKVMTLMHPHNTEMDLSIANALYFAAHGAGLVSSEDNQESPYTTRARVLLSGLGADELFAGYTRHATAYKRRGFEGLLEELDLDISRLGKRNLGRDDRIISSQGREARFPFLDEELVGWALAAPVNHKCGFSEPVSDDPVGRTEGSAAIEPGKKILRCLALKLGMSGVAKEKKRAIQFGARTAKMEAGRTKGTQLLS